MNKVVKEYFEIVCYSVAVGMLIAGLLFCIYFGTITKTTTIRKEKGVRHMFIDIYRWETDIFGNEFLVDHDVAVFGNTPRHQTGKLIL